MNNSQNSGNSATCRLCHKSCKLVDSHLIPSGVYRRIMKAHNEPVNSLVHTNPISGKSLLKPNQLHELLLCENCERCLENGGERYFYSLVDDPKRLQLSQAVKYTQPPYADPGVSAIDLSQAGIDVPKIAHFILGVLWRCNVSDHLELVSYKGALGKLFSAEIEQYLLGGNFPERCMIKLAIYDNEHAFSVLHLPIRQRGNRKSFYFWSNYIHFLGITFGVFRGGLDSTHPKNLSLPCFGRVAFQKEDFRSSALFLSTARAVKETKRVGKLQHCSDKQASDSSA